MKRLLAILVSVTLTLACDGASEVMPGETATVRGRVTYYAPFLGNPPATGVSVIVAHRSGVTDEDGRYVIHDVPEGIQAVTCGSYSAQVLVRPPVTEHDVRLGGGGGGVVYGP